MITLRPARPDEAEALTALCLRSKAVWGYDAAFMAACRAELTLTAADIAGGVVEVAEDETGVMGLCEISIEGETAELEKLFVAPGKLRGGVGRKLFIWALEAARARGATMMEIAADPGAADFYRRMGAVDRGEAPSSSIPGRVLPRLVVILSREGEDPLL